MNLFENSGQKFCIILYASSRLFVILHDSQFCLQNERFLFIFQASSCTCKIFMLYIWLKKCRPSSVQAKKRVAPLLSASSMLWNKHCTAPNSRGGG